MLRELDLRRPHEPHIPNPLKPFRFHEPKVRRLTTIMAVESKDGIVMCADRQETSWVKETVEPWGKLVDIGDFAILGCSGRTDYINEYQERISEGLTRQSKTPILRRLNRLTTDYSRWVVNERIVALKLPVYETGFSARDCFPYAILAMRQPTENKKFPDQYRIFTVEPLGLWLESHNGRAATGSGGVAGTVFLKWAEGVMDNFRLKWSKFSTETIGVVLSYLMRRISEIDPASSGFSMFTLNHAGVTPYFPPSYGDSIVNVAEIVYNDLPDDVKDKIKERYSLERWVKLMGLG